MYPSVNCVRTELQHFPSPNHKPKVPIWAAPGRASFTYPSFVSNLYHFAHGQLDVRDVLCKEGVLCQRCGHCVLLQFIKSYNWLLGFLDVLIFAAVRFGHLLWGPPISRWQSHSPSYVRAKKFMPQQNRRIWSSKMREIYIMNKNSLSLLINIIISKHEFNETWQRNSEHCSQSPAKQIGGNSGNRIFSCANGTCLTMTSRWVWTCKAESHVTSPSPETVYTCHWNRFPCRLQRQHWTDLLKFDPSFF